MGGPVEPVGAHGSIAAPTTTLTYPESFHISTDGPNGGFDVVDHSGAGAEGDGPPPTLLSMPPCSAPR